MKMSKKVAYDFSVDSIVSVDAPAGTSPDDLEQQVLEKLMDRLLSRDITIRFENIFDHATGAYNEDWSEEDDKGE